MKSEGSEHATAAYSPAKALLVLVIIVGVLAAYFGVSALLEIEPAYAGLLFLFYWTAVERSDVKRFAAALAGTLAGVLAAYAAHRLLDFEGLLGVGLALALICGLIYLLLLRRLSSVVNDGCMLLLAVGLIPAVREENPYGEMAVSIILAAAFMAAVIGVLYLATRRRESANKSADMNRIARPPR